MLSDQNVPNIERKHGPKDDKNNNYNHNDKTIRRIILTKITMILITLYLFTLGYCKSA
jgi:hypothetical protein